MTALARGISSRVINCRRARPVTVMLLSSTNLCNRILQILEFTHPGAYVRKILSASRPRFTVDCVQIPWGKESAFIRGSLSPRKLKLSTKALMNSSSVVKFSSVEKKKRRADGTKLQRYSSCKYSHTPMVCPV